MTQKLRAKNLNLVPILHALLQLESVVKAAEELNLTQPTVSGALARLREIYDDPILVRVGRSSQLSPLAMKLKEKVEKACSSLEEVFQEDRFDPAHSEYHFWVAAPDYLVFLITRKLIGRLHKEAPFINVHFVDVPVDLSDQLHDRSIDLAVCADFNLWPNLNSEKLYDEQTIAVVASGHPLLDKEDISVDDLLDYPCTFYDPSQSSRPTKIYAPVHTNIPIMEWNPKMQVSTGQVVDQLFICSETDTVARVPQSIFNYLEKKLRISPLLVNDKSASSTTRMFWSEEQGSSEPGKWLRKVIKESIDDCNFIHR